MQLRLFEVGQDIGRIQAVWTECAARFNSSYYLSWGFVENWLRTLPQDIGLQLALVYESGEPVLAFFFRIANSARAKIFSSRALYINATGISECDSGINIEYNEMICPSSQIPPLVEVLELLPEGWEEVILPGVNTETYPGRSLFEPLKGYEVNFYRDSPSPYVDLGMIREAKGDYLSLLSPNTRRQIRRSYRKYEAQGPVRLEEAGDVGQGLAFFDEMVDLHQALWRDRGKPGAFASGYALKFHRRLIEKRLDFGEIQLLRIKIGSETLGCLYNFIYNNKVYFYQGGLKYQPDQHLKPGYVCHVEAVKHNAQLGHSTYDFLAGVARYKDSLSTHRSRLVWARIQKPRLKFKVENRLRQIKKRFFSQA